MEALVVHIGNFFSQPFTIFFILLLGTRFSLIYLKKLVDNVRENTALIQLLAGLINGLILFLVEYFFPGIPVVFLLIGCPLMVILDICIISDDVPYTYLFLLHKFIMNFICIYWMVVALAGLFPAANIPIGSMEYKITLLAFTLIFSSCWLFFLSKSRLYPFQELYSMIHHRRRGKLFFLYMSVCDIFLILSTIILEPLVGRGIYNEQLSHMVYLELFIKNTLIFGCSYLILFFQARDERQRQQHQEMQYMLDKEKSLRNNAQKKGLLYFFVNVTRNELEEGDEFFAPEALREIRSYEMMVDKFAAECIHPGYQSEFKEKNTVEFFETLLEKNPYFTYQMQVSPEGLMKYFSFPEEISRQFKELKEQWLWVRTDYIITRDSRTNDIYAYLTLLNVDSQVRQSERLKVSATTDALTGVLNRAALEEMIINTLREKNGEGVLLILDIDGFKRVNDVLGHPQGDKVLKTISAILQEAFRNGDILGRLGGDEFCIFISGKISRRTVAARVRDINRRCRMTYYSNEGEEIKISVSIGIAFSKKGRQDYESLYHCADKALYQTKRKGKDGYTVYSDAE
ncbi:MAG: GGDEF domain-containing protein [Lachnospiraceae bacterium]